ncbi:GNAT family N-acetyltransferase [Thorsellia anophelis]|uniref:Acetyltransferase (GNAT) family protein n=1 Tax=Thorsellia anophelis DSM 18579 TaxID=1123402 RepID=A0A1I0BR78_9GAMM|nr:GNAT family N-acetyltransferase [Thorsellia anophelis]SET09575.1 Acetyltransferase (GNAT) family protein [Thorsellia anophelis DSM 18579]
MISVKRATTQDVSLLIPIFNQYLLFYQQEIDLITQEKFLCDRLSHHESIIFIALKDEQIVGFTQIYPTFSSINLTTSLILNDLFVIESARKGGIARLLMDAAIRYGHEIKANGISLETAQDNAKAQALYESLGFEIDEKFIHYFLRLK